MAIYRNIQLTFWTDNKVEDEFTPEDKYFYLYLMTNPQTNICGCYEFSYSQMTRHTGYSKDTISRLLDRFETSHKVIKFNKSNKEILLLNWYKYNWSKSADTLRGVEKVAQHIKTKEFKEYVLSVVESIKGDMPIKSPYEDASNAEYFSERIDSNIDIIKKVINYLNDKCNTKYRCNTPSTKKHINARIRDGYTENDFLDVIDKKFEEWHGTEMEKYLCPDTLFGSKFEKYVNQKTVKHSININADRQAQLDYLLNSISGENENDKK